MEHTEHTPHSEYMEYPFGFGFALMEQPQALEHFNAMSEQEQEELLRKLLTVHTREEMRGFVKAMAASHSKK